MGMHRNLVANYFYRLREIFVEDYYDTLNNYYGLTIMDNY